MDKEQRIALAKRFRDKCKTEGIKKGTKAYKTAHFFYWIAILSMQEVTEQTLDTAITILLMSGRDMIEELLDKDKD